MRLAIVIAGLMVAAAAQGADTNGAANLNIAKDGFVCDAGRGLCRCSAPRQSSSCKAMAVNCARNLECSDATCTCLYRPGFLGGPMKRY